MRPHKSEGAQAPSAVVIGAGLGGLALAVRLQAAGVRTTLVERRDKPGGRAYVYRESGYTFDAGPTVITDPGALEELFALAGRRMSDAVRLVPVDPFYQLRWEDGTVFDYTNDEDALIAQIAARAPSDVDGYRRFLAYSREVMREGYEKLGATAFLKLSNMLAAAPGLVRLSAHRSVYGQVSRFVSDPYLRQAFSFHALLVGGNPFAASAIYTLIHALERKWGVWYAMGGTNALVAALATLFESLGGDLRLNAPVAGIVMRGGRAAGVRLESGETIAAGAVASNADIVHTYEKLLQDEPAAQRRARRLQRYRHSMSLFLIHFGLKRKHPHIKHHTVLFGPRYRALIAEIFRGGALPEDFSLYLHAPSQTDPSVAPEGRSAFYVLSPVPHLGHAPIDWEREGPAYRDRILRYLEEHLIPGLRADLDVCRIFTPADFAQELNAHLGSAFSVEPVLLQSAYFRPHNRDPQIPNLYFAGAGTHPGAGVPGVVASAKATAALMTADLGLAFARAAAE